MVHPDATQSSGACTEASKGGVAAMAEAKKLHWQPQANMHTLQARAQLLQQIRSFFQQREVLEVQTPLLAQDTVTDIHLESLQVLPAPQSMQSPCASQSTPMTQAHHDRLQPLGYLQTSPEYMMKRLLAAGSGPIYQICPAFRQDECGRYHQPEFSLLEWYRPGFSMSQLIAEVDSLLQAVASTMAMHQVSYHDLFQQYCGLNPHVAGLAELYDVAAEQQIDDFPTLAAGDRDTALQIIMAQIIEPKLACDLPTAQPCCVVDFPASQAALACLRSSHIKGVAQVAERFEVYWRGMELANGYHELTDVDEQRLRFQQQQTLRQRRGQFVPALDEKLLAALAHGLPACSGVALGIDRLLMAIAGLDRVQQGMAFAEEF